MARLTMLSAFWIPWVVCTYLAFAPSPPDAVFKVSDVLLHGFAFSYLTFALSLAHHAKRWVLAVAWMIAYGVAIELVQSFEPERSAEWKDILVDVAGIGIGVVAFRLFGGQIESLVNWLADTVAGWLPSAD
ncbi:MAG: VanZ family protein [Gammaproteobacteria bacterium]|nr:VanZ family protein [Gammaproteobacteria bacterium]